MRNFLFSFIGHVVILGGFFAIGSIGGRGKPEARVYMVSIVPGASGPGGPGGRAGVSVAGLVGRPGKIGGDALPKTAPPKGTALVDEARKKAAAKKAKADSSSNANPNQIALRVYGQGGVIVERGGALPTVRRDGVDGAVRVLE